MEENEAKAILEILRKILNGEILDKIVGNQKYSGNIYVPKKYIGKRVLVFLIDNENKNGNIEGQKSN
jgi:hypothetical protein